MYAPSSLLPPVVLDRIIDCNSNVRILQLRVAAADGTQGRDPFARVARFPGTIVFVLTVGHQQGDLSAAQNGAAPTLRSVLAPIATETELIQLPPPWTSFEPSGEVTYSWQLRKKSGINGDADGLNTSFVSCIIKPGSVGPIRLQEWDALGSSLAVPGEEDRTFGALSRRLLAHAAELVDPALFRPLGNVQAVSPGSSHVELVQDHQASQPHHLGPLYIGTDLSRRLALMHPSAGGWRSESSLTEWLLKGPGIIANSVLQAALDHQHARLARPEEEREELRWVLDGGSGLPRGGNVRGQPDFVLEHRAGPHCKWTVLVTAETKIFVASPLLVKLLRLLNSQGSATLATSHSPRRPAWDRLVTQMALEVARAGAHCAALWTGLDWLILDRHPDEAHAITFRAWPKLLRSTVMRRADVHEAGFPTEPGTTRHDLPQMPGTHEEECDLNEAGILISLALHAYQRSRSHSYARTNLNLLSSNSAVTPLSSFGAASGSEESRLNLLHEGDAFGGGTFATVHRASLAPADAADSSAPMTLVAKLARDEAPWWEEDWWTDAKTGPHSFAAITRRMLAVEAAVYRLAADLQGSVLPEVKAEVSVIDPALYSEGEEEDADDSGEMNPPSLTMTASTTSLSDSVDLPPETEPNRATHAGRDGEAFPFSNDPRGVFKRTTDGQPLSSELIAQSPRPEDVQEVAPRVKHSRTPSVPDFLNAIVLTFAGYSLRDLAPAHGEEEEEQLRELREGRPRPPIPLLRDFVAAAGLKSKAEASRWLQTALRTALHALHSRGVAHGDISAGNVCLERLTDGQESPSEPSLRLRLIDLGQAVLKRLVVNAQDFDDAVAQDLDQGRQVIQRAVDKAWADDMDEDQEGGSSDRSDGSRTPTPMPADAP